MIGILMICSPYIVVLFFAYCVFNLIETGSLPDFKREKNKKIKSLKRELRRVKKLEWQTIDWNMVKKYRKRIEEIEDLIQEEVDRELGINKKNSPWE